LVLSGCGDDKPAPKAPLGQTPYSAGPAGKPGTIDQGSPTSLAEGIFGAVRAGDFAALQGIAAPDADRHAKDVANVGSAPADKQADFKKQFEKGKATGEKVDGDKAEVTILFGPDGTKPETFHMVKRNGKWYLQGF
jgi:hypothetical protein